MYEVIPLRKGWWQVVWEGPNTRRAADMLPYTFKQNAIRRARQLNALIRGACHVCGEPATSLVDGTFEVCAICLLKLQEG